MGIAGKFRLKDEIQAESYEQNQKTTVKSAIEREIEGLDSCR